MNTTTIPSTVVDYADEWASEYVREHPTWASFGFWEDDWNSWDGYDLNLYIEDGVMTITAYETERDEFGFLKTKTDSGQAIVRASVCIEVLV